MTTALMPESYPPVPASHPDGSGHVRGVDGGRYVVQDDPDPEQRPPGRERDPVEGQAEVTPRHQGNPAHEPEGRRLTDPPDLQADLQPDEHHEAGQQDQAVPDDHEERGP